MSAPSGTPHQGLALRGLGFGFRLVPGGLEASRVATATVGGISPVSNDPSQLPVVRMTDRDLHLHRRLVQPPPPALHARLPLLGRVRAAARRARSTGVRDPEIGQRIGRVDLAEGLKRAYNAPNLDGRRRSRCRGPISPRERTRVPSGSARAAPDAVQGPAAHRRPLRPVVKEQTR
jgi:hypothetical protein